ncbi:hypothetical protein DRN87_00915 [Candidatus Geothermarchaeota archaeon]|nr:MAG: hypothetical protein DRN87_00915 [Candidatus Geothermarchaeota archaeon]
MHHFLEENGENILSSEMISYADALVVEVEGVDDEGSIKYRATLLNEVPLRDLDKRREYFNKFGILHFLVSIPAITGARLLFEEEDYGVIALEVFDPNKFLSIMKKTGYKPGIIIETIREYL